MSRHNRLSGDAGYCDTCDRFVYVPRHECDGPPLTTLMAQVRRQAYDDDVALRQSGPMWMAEDALTGEKASDHSMVGAWAALRGVEPTTIYRRLRDAGVAPLPVGERDLGGAFDDYNA